MLDYYKYIHRLDCDLLTKSRMISLLQALILWSLLHNGRSR